MLILIVKLYLPHQVFQPYAKFWLQGLTRFIVNGNHGGEGIHYFVVDIMVTMLSWATTAVLEVCVCSYIIISTSSSMTRLTQMLTLARDVKLLCKI